MTLFSKLSDQQTWNVAGFHSVIKHVELIFTAQPYLLAHDVMLGRWFWPAVRQMGDGKHNLVWATLYLRNHKVYEVDTK